MLVRLLVVVRILLLTVAVLSGTSLGLPDILTPPRSSLSNNVFPRLTWLRDTVIESIFGLPRRRCHEATSHGRNLRGPDHHPQLPRKLLARYGEDVVLRFNLSTAEEERALAEAADTLFLDVWEFTSNWADIRLRKDDVHDQIPWHITISAANTSRLRPC